MRKKITENEFVIIEFLDDIVIITWKVDMTDIELVKKMVDLRLKVTPDEPYLFIANVMNVKKSTKEARDYLASKKGSERVIAAALIVDSMLTATLANFFMRVSKPLVTTKLFTEEEEAIRWLKTVNKNNAINKTVSI